MPGAGVRPAPGGVASDPKGRWIDEVKHIVLVRREFFTSRQPAEGRIPILACPRGAVETRTGPRRRATEMTCRP